MYSTEETQHPINQTLQNVDTCFPCTGSRGTS